MNAEEHEFELGDSVIVRDDVQHPDFDEEISGWQGRIVEINPHPTFGTLVGVEWDSITLKNMPAYLIEESEVEGLDWARTYLVPEGLVPVEPRDSVSDVTKVAGALADQYQWAFLGQQGMRIQAVLADVDEEDPAAVLAAWADHMEENLTFPFEVEVAEYRERGPLQQGDRFWVHRISLVDDSHGIIVAGQDARRSYDFPLSALEVVDEDSANYQAVDDYATWFDNR
jgi:hypothetical protein